MAGLSRSNSVLIAGVALGLIGCGPPPPAELVFIDPRSNQVQCSDIFPQTSSIGYTVVDADTHAVMWFNNRPLEDGTSTCQKPVNAWDGPHRYWVIEYAYTLLHGNCLGGIIDFDSLTGVLRRCQPAVSNVSLECWVPEQVYEIAPTPDQPFRIAKTFEDCGFESTNPTQTSFDTYFGSGLCGNNDATVVDMSLADKECQQANLNTSCMRIHKLGRVNGRCQIPTPVDRCHSYKIVRYAQGCGTLLQNDFELASGVGQRIENSSKFNASGVYEACQAESIEERCYAPVIPTQGDWDKEGVLVHPCDCGSALQPSTQDVTDYLV